MLNYLLFTITKNLPCRLIPIEGKPYLERYYVGELFGVTYYLHRFVGRDAERHVHDHPWEWALSIVLAGWYEEELVSALDINQGWISRRRIVRWYNHITEGTFHRITETAPGTWTLFFHGARDGRTWGFLTRMPAPTPGQMGTLYHQPYDVKANEGWWEYAPVGTESGREPL